MRTPSHLGSFLAFGLYNSIFFSCSAILFLWWFLSFVFWFLLQFPPCACDVAPTIMFIDYFFPREITKAYFLNWVYAFASVVLLESYLMILLVLKSKVSRKKTFVFTSLFLACIHNLPSALVILTLMAQKEYIGFYIVGVLLSIPAFYTYRPLFTIQ